MSKKPWKRKPIIADKKQIIKKVKKPGQDQPGQEPPASVKPGQDQPGGGQPGQDQPGQEPPASVKPGQDQPGGGQLKSEILDHELSKVLAQPGQDRPGGGQPGQDQPLPHQPGFYIPPKVGPEPEDFKTFQDGIKGIFDVIAARAGEHWRIDEREAATISKPLTKIFYKYAPNWQYSDEMFLAVALGSIILPRINYKPDGS